MEEEEEEEKKKKTETVVQFEGSKLVDWVAIFFTAVAANVTNRRILASSVPLTERSNPLKRADRAYQFI